MTSLLLVLGIVKQVKHMHAGAQTASHEKMHMMYYVTSPQDRQFSHSMLEQ